MTQLSECKSLRTQIIIVFNLLPKYVKLFNMSDEMRRAASVSLAAVLIKCSYKKYPLLAKYVSEKALKLAEPTPEHSYRAIRAAKTIVREYSSGKIANIDDLFVAFKKYLFQIGTTPEENRLVRLVYQEEGDIDWRLAYKKAGIVLYKVERIGKTKSYTKAKNILKMPKSPVE